MRRLVWGIAAIATIWAQPAQALLDLGVLITNVSDITIPNWYIGNPDITATMDLCIFSLAVLPTGKYGVRVSSTGGYNLTGPNGSIPYQIYWNDGGAGNLSGLGSQLTNNVRLGGRNNAQVLSYNCSLAPVGNNARLTFKVTQAAMTSALQGTYQGTINITISPD